MSLQTHILSLLAERPLTVAQIERETGSRRCGTVVRELAESDIVHMNANAQWKLGKRRPGGRPKGSKAAVIQDADYKARLLRELQHRIAIPEVQADLEWIAEDMEMRA